MSSITYGEAEKVSRANFGKKFKRILQLIDIHISEDVHETQRYDRLSRIISRCSRIEHVCLDSRWLSDDPCMRNALKNVKIDNLNILGVGTSYVQKYAKYAFFQK